MSKRDRQSIYEVARTHGYANVDPSDSREILALEFGPLDAQKSDAAKKGYEAGRKEAVEHAAELTRPVPFDSRIPF